MKRTTTRLTFVSLGCIAALLLINTSAFAASLTNAGFENGLTGWTVVNGGASTVTSHTPASGPPAFFAQQGNVFLQLAGSGCGEHTVSQTLVLASGQKVRGFAAFSAFDYLPFNDYAHVRILDGTMTLVATPFSSNISAVGSFGHTPWTMWTYTTPTTGTYTVQYAAANTGDCNVTSDGLFDASGATTLYAGRVGSTLVALLQGQVDGKPIAGVPITFTCGVCAPGSYTAITNGAGIATTPPLPQASLSMATQGKWTARFFGNGTWDPSSTLVGNSPITKSASRISFGTPSILTTPRAHKSLRVGVKPNIADLRAKAEAERAAAK